MFACIRAGIRMYSWFTAMINDRLSAILVFLIFGVSFVVSSMVFVAWERRSSVSFAGLLPALAHESPPLVAPVGIAAEAYVVATLSGEILAENNAYRSYPMASLTKIMTGLLLKEWGESATIWITPHVKEVDTKHSKVPVGEILSPDAAFALLLAESDNDIAEAVADSVGVFIDGRAADPRGAFIGAMNEKAVKLGMHATHFDNPSGLDDAHQYSSAFDMLRLLRHTAEKYEDFWDVTVDPPSYVHAYSGKRYPLQSSSILNNAGIVGVKTGFSPDAKGALLLRYRMREFPEDLVIVILRSPDRFGDGERLIAAIRGAFHR